MKKAPAFRALRRTCPAIRSRRAEYGRCAMSDRWKFFRLQKSTDRSRIFPIFKRTVWITEQAYISFRPATTRNGSRVEARSIILLNNGFESNDIADATLPHYWKRNASLTSAEIRTHSTEKTSGAQSLKITTGAAIAGSDPLCAMDSSDNAIDKTTKTQYIHLINPSIRTIFIGITNNGSIPDSRRLPKGVLRLFLRLPL